MTLPDDPLLERLASRGAALLDAGRPFDAVDVLRHAVAAGEEDACELLVRAYVESRSWHACAEWLTPLVERGETRFAGTLGAALAAVGDRNRAEYALRLAIDAGDVAAANDLAILLRDEGRLAESVQVLDRAVAAGDGQAAANLVAILVEAGALTDAIAAAERHCDPAFPDTLVALADVRVETRRDDEAEALYRQACELGAMRAHIAYGTFRWNARADAEGAEGEFRAAAERREPGWAATLGRFLYEEGRGEEARWYLTRATAEGDGDAEQLLADLDGRDLADD